MSGASSNLKNWLDRVKKDIDTDEPAPANLYLGCKHEANDVLLGNGANSRKIVYTMGDCLKTTAEQYTELCYAATSERVVLRKVATPFIDEDDTVAGPKTPYTEGPCIVCT